MTFFSTITKVVNHSFLPVSMKKIVNRTYQQYVIQKIEKIINFPEIVQDISSTEEIIVREKKIIWTMWWQGEESAPDFVKAAWNSVQENTSFELKILSKENYENYVAINPVVMEKFYAGNFTVVHLTDIIRMGLLAQRGGVWFDSTIVALSDIDEFLSQAFITIKSNFEDYRFVSSGKWTGYLLGGNKERYFSVVFEALEQYWIVQQKQIDYFLLDYILEITYQHNYCGFRQVLDSLNEVDYDVLALQNKFNSPGKQISQFVRPVGPSLYKGNYKIKLNLTVDNERTIYGVLYDRWTKTTDVPN